LILDIFPLHIHKNKGLGRITQNSDKSVAAKVYSSLLTLLPIEQEIKSVGMPTHDYTTLSKIASIPLKEDRKKIFEKMEKIGVAETRKLVPLIKKAPYEVKQALLVF